MSRKTKIAKSKGKDGIFTVPAYNTVTRKGVSPMQIALNRTPLLPAFVKVPRMLYYEANLALSVPNTGNAIQYFFTANGLFDPNITGTGHQPIGFDQMMVFFEQYTVTHSSISCFFRPLGSLAFSLSLAPDTTQITNSSQLVENGLIKFDERSNYSTENGLAFPKQSLDCDVKGYFGQRTDREMLNDTNLFGTAAANPTEQVYFAIGGWESLGLSGAGVTLNFDVLLSYDAIFWEPRKASESAKKESERPFVMVDGVKFNRSAKIEQKN